MQFSPFEEGLLAVCSAQHFGIAGNGKLLVVRTGPQGVLVEQEYMMQDGAFDCCWSEANEHHLLSACGDGAVRLWDKTVPQFPVQQYAEHQREVFGVAWNLISKDTFASSSWDHTVKLVRERLQPHARRSLTCLCAQWNPHQPASLMTFAEHTACVYTVQWSPQEPTVMASASGDWTVKVWDVRGPASVATVRAHNHEVLALDWNKYMNNTIVTASADRTACVWDLRNPNAPIARLEGHTNAIRRVKCYPHHGNVIATASYDTTLRLWDFTKVRSLRALSHTP